jgi:hypothetical protein
MVVCKRLKGCMTQVEWLYGTGGMVKGAGGMVVWYRWNGCMVQVYWLFGTLGMFVW